MVSLVSVLLATATGPLAAGPASAQDFDPRGRHKPTAPAGKPSRPGARPGGAAKPPAGARPTPPRDPAAGGAGEAGASSSVLIDRYTKIAVSQPGSPFPLQRLAQLYRDKDGNLNALVAEFEKRALVAGADQYASLVTLAGVYKIDGRAEEAIRTYEKAIALKANDSAALLALARLLQDRGDVAGARARYQQALALQTVAVDKEQTLRTLMGLALDAKDFTAAKDAQRPREDAAHEPLREG